MNDNIKLSACLWFDTQAEDAAKFYTGIFPNSKITNIARYSEAGREMHKREPGSVLLVRFELNGQEFWALNGGPGVKFNEGISFPVACETQREIDFFWEKLSAGGDKNAQQCGWLKDKFGVSWQIFPRKFLDMIKDHNSPSGQRAMNAMMGMKKMDMAELEKAYAG